MASKRRKRRNGCKGKQRHENQTKAVAHAVSLRKRQNDFLSAYHCKFCKGWHVGH